MSEWFSVNAGLGQACVMFPWLFNVYIDDVVKEVNARVIGKRFELLFSKDERFEINKLLFAYDTAIELDSEEKLC